MTDAELDLEIQAALHAEPSPEFLARVRMRVAADSAPSLRRWSFLLPLAGAAAAAVVFAVAVENRITAPRPIPSERQGTDISLAPARQVEPVGQVGPAGQVGPVGQVRQVGSLLTKTSAPKVLISRAETEATERAIARARQGYLLPGTTIEFTSATASLASLDDLAVADLSVEPLGH